MPTGSQDKAFSELMEGEATVGDVKVGYGALDEAIYWIAKNLNPDDVFDEKDLKSWAESNGYTKE